MGQTLIEKIIGNKVGKRVQPGDIVTVDVDWCMIDDIMVPFAVQKFEEMGFSKVANPAQMPTETIRSVLSFGKNINR